MVSKILSGALSPSLLAEWWLIHLILLTFKILVRPPGQFSADNACETAVHSDNLNAAIPSH
jgi:hypothetical protein